MWQCCVQVLPQKLLELWARFEQVCSQLQLPCSYARLLHFGA